MKSAPLSKILTPFFALGMGVQIQEVNTSFLQTPPSAEEIPYDQLQERQDVSPADSLRSLPGLVLTGSEVTTYTSSLFLRGSDSDHTLFVWNDFRSDNFTAPAGATDPFGVSSEFSNRFRILKGPQSLLYGTEALGGVVLIDQDPDVGSVVEVGSGSLNTSRGFGEFRFRGDKWKLALGGSAFSSEGVSTYNAALPRGEEGRLERDGRQKSSASVIASFDFRSEDQLQLMVNGLEDSLSDDVPPLDDVNAHSKNRSLQWKLRYQTRWSDKADSSFLFTQQKTDRESINAADTYSAESYLSQVQGQRRIFLNRNNFQWLKSGWQVGLESLHEQGEFSWTSNTPVQSSSFSPTAEEQSLYVVNSWTFPSSDFSWGVRESCQNSKECVAVQQVSFQKHWGEEQPSFYGILSSGLKRPSLYQLHASSLEGGNPDLRAETSRAYEVGLIQRWGALQKLRLSAFENSFSDLIVYDFVSSRFSNLSKAKTRGLELLHQYEAVMWDTQVSLAQIYAKDELSGSRLLRRPVLQGAWELSYSLLESLRVRNEFVYVGDREDSLGANQRTTLNAVLLWNVAVTYQGAYGHYFLRVNNLSNTFYEDIKNYQTQGRFVWLGARWLY